MFPQIKDSDKKLGQAPIATEVVGDPWVGKPVNYCVAEAVAVDFNSATAQTLYTPPSTSGRYFHPTKFVFRDPSLSLDTASYSVGSNSTSYNDLVANATHTGLTAAGKYIDLPVISTGATRVTAGSAIKVLMNTVQGAAATGYCDVFGYYTAA